MKTKSVFLIKAISKKTFGYNLGYTLTVTYDAQGTLEGIPSKMRSAGYNSALTYPLRQKLLSISVRQ